MRILRRGLTLVVLFVALGLVGGFAASAATTKVYRANVQLVVTPSGASRNVLLAAENTFTQALVQSLTSLANAPSVTASVIHQLHLHLTRQQLAGKITADAPPNEVLINLHVTDHNPHTAALIANAVATSFADVVEGIEPRTAHDKVTIIKPASVPADPVSPNTSLDAALGAGVGLLLGLGALALLRRRRSAPDPG